jgi:signal transduction histidine kinase
VRTADERRIYIGSVAMMLTMTATAFMARPGAFISEWIGRMLVLTVIGAIAMALRGMNQAKTANERALDEHRRAEAITAQRDAALKRSRIAGQLHDSVGHGLTTIIALSEGLTGKTADPRVEDALTGINQIARESLSDTREAVRALAETDGIESMGETPGEASPESDASAHSHISPYTWDDIKPILAHVRALGIIALFTETGRRSDDPAQADLCFTITREAITNAIRHGSEITHISVAWDHADDGGITVLIRDDGMGIGSSAKVPTVAPIGSSAASNSQHNRMPHSNGGTGLPRLADTVRAAGGSMEHGPQDDGDGWQVKAVLPAGRSCQLGLGERDAA